MARKKLDIDEKRVRMELYLRPETKAAMELLYTGLCGVVTEDGAGKVRVVVSRSLYWENVIMEHLASQEELLRIFGMMKAGTFGKE